MEPDWLGQSRRCLTHCIVRFCFALTLTHCGSLCYVVFGRTDDLASTLCDAWGAGICDSRLTVPIRGEVLPYTLATLPVTCKMTALCLSRELV